MIAVYVGLSFVIAVFVVGTIVTARRTVRVIRDVGSFLRTFAAGMEALSRRLARLGDSAAGAAERPADVEEALARLSVSRARLQVLTSALGRVRAEAAGLTDLYPRKAPRATPTIRPRGLGPRGRLK